MPSLLRKRSLKFLKQSFASNKEDAVPPLPPPKGPSSSDALQPSASLSVSSQTALSGSDASKSSLNLSRKASQSGGKLFRRVSTMLLSNKKPTSDAASTHPYGSPLGNIAPKKNRKDKKSKKKKTADDSLYSIGSLSDEEDSIDEIRRPSGLGDSVSIHSQRTMPNDNSSSPYSEKGDPFSDNDLNRVVRMSSTPNLLGGYKWKGEINLPGLDFHRADDDSGFQEVEQKKQSPSVVLPVEVLEIVLSHLPHNLVAGLAPVSKAYYAAAQTTLYRHLDFQTIPDDKIESLVVTVSSNVQIPDLVRSFHCSKWPSSFLDTEDGQGIVSSPLGKRFAFALERMGFLTSMSLPDFDSELLQYHSAFGLKTIAFHMRELAEDTQTTLLSWLDGQINITSLSFPQLRDEPNRISSHLKSRSVPDLQAADALLATPENTSSFLALNPSPMSTPINTPMSAQFPSVPTAPQSGIFLQSASPTLLPNLSHLHAPSSLVQALAPSRPHLKHVFVNLDTTLYTGLRPTKLMASLRGVTKLGLRVGNNVDRRTVEKVLGAVGTVLGSPGEDGTDVLEELEVQVHFEDPGSDDVLYKILHTVLPRYSALKTIKLIRIPSPKLADDATNLPIVVSPSTPPRTPTDLLSPSQMPGTPRSSRRTISLKSPIRTSFSSSDLPPPSPFRDYHEALTEHDQFNVNIWIGQAPTLEEITLLSGATWSKEEDEANSDDSKSPS